MGTCLKSGFDRNEPSLCCFCLLEDLSAALRGQVMGQKKVAGVFVHREMEKYRTSDSAPCFPGDRSLRATLFCALSPQPAGLVPPNLALPQRSQSCREPRSLWAFNGVQPFHRFRYAGLPSFMTGTWFTVPFYRGHPVEDTWGRKSEPGGPSTGPGAPALGPWVSTIPPLPERRGTSRGFAQ